MREQIVAVSTAKANLLRMVRAMEEEGREYILTKDGEPVGALIPMEEFEAYLETRDVASSPHVMEALKQALRDEKQGRLWQRRIDGKWVRAKGASRKK